MDPAAEILTSISDVKIKPLQSRIAHKHELKTRTQDIHLDENIKFVDLGLSKVLIKGLTSSGFDRPSPIQLSAIPIGRCGLDLVVQAKSGTGKTCVFSIIALDSLDISVRRPQVLMLAPTREIALQIEDVVKGLGSAIEGLTAHSAIGGLSYKEDKDKVNKAHIVIGTPGRVKHLMGSAALDTSSVRLLVLDEADKLLEDSFQEQVNWVYSGLPDSKQVIAASATYTEKLVQHLCNYMHNPTFVRLNSNDPVLIGVRQYKKIIEEGHLPSDSYNFKVAALLMILSQTNFQQCLIFSNLVTRAENLSKLMESRGWPSTHIAGSLEQGERIKAITKLKSYDCRILVSTDLTSRGIDADRVDLVVNLDLPYDHETYLHRVGRAGRFGAKGAAITLYTQAESVKLDRIAEKINTTIETLPDKLEVDFIENPVTSCDSKKVAQVESFQIVNHSYLQSGAKEETGVGGYDGNEVKLHNAESAKVNNDTIESKAGGANSTNTSLVTTEENLPAVTVKHVNGATEVVPPSDARCTRAVVVNSDQSCSTSSDAVGKSKTLTNNKSTGPPCGTSAVNEINCDKENTPGTTEAAQTNNVLGNKGLQTEQVISHRPPFSSLLQAMQYVQNPDKFSHFLDTTVYADGSGSQAEVSESVGTSEATPYHNTVPEATPYHNAVPEASPYHNAVHKATLYHNTVHKATPYHNAVPEATPYHNAVHKATPCHNTVPEATPYHNTVPEATPYHNAVPEASPYHNTEPEANVSEVTETEYSKPSISLSNHSRAADSKSPTNQHRATHSMSAMMRRLHISQRNGESAISGAADLNVAHGASNSLHQSDVVDDQCSRLNHSTSFAYYANDDVSEKQDVNPPREQNQHRNSKTFHRPAREQRRSQFCSAKKLSTKKETKHKKAEVSHSVYQSNNSRTHSSYNTDDEYRIGSWVSGHSCDGSVSPNSRSHHRRYSTLSQQDRLRQTLDIHYRQVYMQHSYIVKMGRKTSYL